MMQRELIYSTTEDKRENFRLKEAIGSSPNIEEVYEDTPKFKHINHAQFHCTDEDQKLDYFCCVIHAVDPDTEEHFYINTSSSYFIESMKEVIAEFPEDLIVIKQYPSNKNKGKFFYRATIE